MHRKNFIVAVLMISILAAGCAPAATVVPESTPVPQNVAPSVAVQASETPPAEGETPTAAPFVLDFTAVPTATSLPTLEIPTRVTRPPGPQVWQGLPTYPAESNPSYYFQVTFDPNAWALSTDNYGAPALVHRAISSCVVTPTGGRDLPPSATVEHAVREINKISYQVGAISVNGIKQSVTYAAGDGRIYTAFQVWLGDRPDQCLLEAETVLGSLTSVPVAQATPIGTP